MIIPDGELRAKREELSFQLDVPELKEVLSEVNPPMNFLVFGLGNDSVFWNEVNKGGRTVFLEDIAGWFENVKKKHPELEAYLVHYDTVLSDWESLIDNQHKLKMNDIPAELRAVEWDVILVDGPMQYKPDKPGRMKSIYEASRLIKPGGHVFVHDAHSDTNTAYSRKYLLRENFVRRVSGFSILNHYHIQQVLKHK